MLLPHTGWPGTPRNAGLDAATGTYVFFADHDDHFGDDALRTMVDHADAWGSDVLVPRLTRVGSAAVDADVRPQRPGREARAPTRCWST